MQYKRLLAITILAVAILSLTITVGTYAKSNINYDRPDPRRIADPPTINPTIQFIKWERSQSGVKFTYQVTAGSKDISYWLLESPVFKKTQLQGTSESNINYNQKLMYIKFNTNIKAGQTKIIWFDLKLNYNGFKLGYIPYEIQAGGLHIGLVKGPELSSSYTMPHL